jgi:uncharacterized protein
MSAVVDTNILVFDTFEDSAQHDEAVKALNALETWIIPGIVLHEYVWFMKDQLVGVEETRLKVEEYLTDAKTRFRTVDADDISFSLQNAKRLRDYNDMLVLSSARRLGLPLLTFDKDLSKSAKRLGVSTIS